MKAKVFLKLFRAVLPLGPCPPLYTNELKDRMFIERIVSENENMNGPKRVGVASLMIIRELGVISVRLLFKTHFLGDPCWRQNTGWTGVQLLMLNCCRNLPLHVHHILCVYVGGLPGVPGTSHVA